MLRAPETEALHGDYAPIEPRDPRVDGSTVPLGSTATHETIRVSKILWGEVEVPRCHRAKNPVDQEAQQSHTN
jgi:hypothetical protein